VAEESHSSYQNTDQMIPSVKSKAITPDSSEARILFNKIRKKVKLKETSGEFKPVTSHRYQMNQWYMISSP